MHISVKTVLLIFICISLQLWAQEDLPGTGALRIQGTAEAFFPLRHTDVAARISGNIAEVTVKQEYENSLDHTVEAVYIFPLPAKAAVVDLVMHIGERRIRGVIKERGEARRMYEQARQQGQTAALLEQERPNIFCQSVANIHPGDAITIAITYTQDLVYQDGRYEYRFPMVVGPRYHPAPAAGRDSGTPGSRPVTPPYLKPGQRSGHDVGLQVTIDAGAPITRLECLSHAIRRSVDSGKAIVQLKRKRAIANKDFILRYSMAADELRLPFAVHCDDNGGYFLLMLQPKQAYGRDEVVPKEIIFVVDNSGSMSGEPMAKAKEAMRYALDNLNAKDSFNILRFSESASGLSPTLLPATGENITRGLSYVNGMRGMGPTEMTAGIRAALTMPRSSNSRRYVLFMTDGYIGNEQEIFALIDRQIGDCRLFSFGVGNSVNHYLLSGMARMGRGRATYVPLAQDSKQAVEGFYRQIANPVLVDLSLTVAGVDTYDVFPATLPDLFAQQPLVIAGRYRGHGRARVSLSGRHGGGDFRQTWELDFPEKRRAPAVRSLWARYKMADLHYALHSGDRQTIKQQMIDLSIGHRLLCEYTAFVAVEEQVRQLPSGRTETIQIPLEMPEGVAYEGVFGRDKGTGARLRSPQTPSMAGHSRTQACVVEESIDMDATCDRPGEKRPAAALQITITSKKFSKNLHWQQVEALVRNWLRDGGFHQGPLELVLEIDAQGALLHIRLAAGSMDRQDIENLRKRFLRKYPRFPANSGVYSLHIHIR